MTYIHCISSEYKQKTWNGIKKRSELPDDDPIKRLINLNLDYQRKVMRQLPLCLFEIFGNDELSKDDMIFWKVLTMKINIKSLWL